MTRQETLRKLISIRHHCFLQGVKQGEAGFRDAFVTVNGIYVEMRDNRQARNVAPKPAAHSKSRLQGHYTNATPAMDPFMPAERVALA